MCFQARFFPCFDFYSDGRRQLVSYSFPTPNALESSAVILEPKTLPAPEENTFTSLAISPDHKRLVAMTYGGKALVYDVPARKKVHTIAAHAESDADDGTHVFIAPP